MRILIFNRPVMNTNGRVRGEVAVVTGGSLGIGRACALRLAEHGAAVAVTDVLDDEGRAVVEEIRAGGGTAEYWHLDVADEQQCKQVIDEAAAKFGKLTVLINNAGVSGANRPTHEITEDEWDHVMSINVKGVFFCTKHAIPHMKAAGKGSIVNLSSIYGLVGAPDVPPYHASKGAVTLMSKTDALIYAADKIRVNSLHPGYIWTPMVEKHLASMGDVEEGREALKSLHPIGEVGESDDIAWGVVYLASDESKFITGSELVIDGGYTAR
jgi:NAD(P)-dependent dehydrogenase (short-subunit alcohol dehydrogenase family)